MICSLLLEELTIPALGDNFHRVIHSCRPIEFMFECFVNDRLL
jgi:hypothetical protein